MERESDMTFTKLGSIIAWLLLALGGFRVVVGFLLAFGAEDNEAAAQQILAAANTGEAINEGMIAIFVGVALGILVEISKTLRAKQESEL